VRLVAINVAVLAAMLVAIEGASSLMLAGVHLFTGDPPETIEARITRYDPELGWVSIPGNVIPAYAGPRRPLRVNGQGFRADHELTPAPPPGRVRVVCSGDSFTFGADVSDEYPWCRRLERLDPRLETVNMAVLGYGLDQIYLRYKRDAAGLSHDIHVVAFIDDDIRRMGVRQGKPVLTMSNGRLAVENVPVPPPLSRWRTHVTRVLLDLSAYQLIARAEYRVQHVLGRTGGPAPGVLDALVDDFVRVTRERGSRIVFVRLPTLGEEDVAARALMARARQQGATAIDLWDDFKRLAPEARPSLFVDPVPAGTHLSEAGNEWAAARILRGLPPLDP
jgi:hypothetical protein